MRMQVTPNAWSCLPTAFAIALEVPLAEVLEGIGHDGSEVAWPDLPEPLRRRAFHIQELVLFAFRRSAWVIPFDALPTQIGAHGVTPLLCEYGFEEILRSNFGVLTGLNYAEQRHAVAWDGREIWDPNGRCYSPEDFHIETFWAIKSAEKFS